MSRSWSIVVIAAVAAMVVAGCGQGAGEGPSGPKPPDSTLTFANRSVSGVLGSYCWSSPSGATCADAAGIPVAQEQQTLTVSAGSVLMFDYGGGRSPDSVEARAYPLEQEQQWMAGPDGTRLMRPKGGRSALAVEDLRARREGDRTNIPAKLGPGEYAVEISVRAPEGDASYYFRVAVEGNASKPPDHGDPEY